MARSMRKSCAANRLRPSTARVGGGAVGSEGDSRERDSRGRPQFSRLSPRSSSAFYVRRRQPGRRDGGTAARARRTQPVRARDRWRRPRWVSRPSRGCFGARPTMAVQRSVQRRAIGAGDLEVTGVGWRGSGSASRFRSGTATPTSQPPRDAMVSRGAPGRHAGKPALPSRAAGKKQPDFPTEQHAKQWAVSQQEQPEVHRRRTRDEVDEDVVVCVGLHPDGTCRGSSGRVFSGPHEEEIWVVPNLQTIAEMPDEVTTLIHRRAEPDELAIVEDGRRGDDAKLNRS